jgi:transposase
VLSLTPAVRIFLCSAPVDMRRGFDGLARMAEDVFRQAPTSGHLFVFRNRRRDRVKILYWDRDGFALWTKRLERGTFSIPEADAAGVEIRSDELALLLGGIDLAGARRRKRFTLHPAVAPRA